MSNWNSIVAAFFGKADPENLFRHCVGDGASLDAIQAAESEIGIRLPDELREFYLNCNGLGLSAGDEPDVPRFIRPIEQLPAFVRETRADFAGTHSDLASRFLAFVDWENGDAMGYLQQPDRTFFPFLVTFLHEQYRYDAAQDPNDFLTPGPASLIEFLS